MTARLPRLLLAGALVASVAVVASNQVTAGRPDAPGGNRTDDVAAYWTPEKVAAAQPRDLVIDERGLGYLRSSDGGLTPYGHSVRARLVQESAAAPNSPTPKAPPSGGDRTGPTVSNASPDRDTVGGSVTFTATVDDPDGIKSVSFVIIYPDGREQSFTPTASGDVYSTSLSGFSNGEWGWYVVAKDGAGRGGNTTTTDPPFPFQVDVGGGGGDPVDPPPADDIVTNSRWVAGGDVQLAAGRILFEMPEIRGRNKIVGWTAYVCSGTAVTDTNDDASVILTAAHCVYDDVAKTFARNVIFIPNQAGGGSGTDANCDNDPIGCWSPSHGVVDANWTTRTFPDNVEWDYAYYVAPNGSHSGSGVDVALEDAVNELTIGFSTGAADTTTHALGYSYSDDPNFMYCAEPMGTQSPVNWWLPNCELSGGSSGGPWVQLMNETSGTGPIISVNSWGYTTQPGMAGPLLDDSAQCVFAAANDKNASPSNRGITVDCSN